jgi:hypothetical protein
LSFYTPDEVSALSVSALFLLSNTIRVQIPIADPIKRSAGNAIIATVMVTVLAHPCRFRRPMAATMLRGTTIHFANIDAMEIQRRASGTLLKLPFVMALYPK